MEPILYLPRAVLRGTLIVALSLSVFAQISAAPDASGLPLRRKTFPPALITRPVFEFRGIRIGDEMKGAERKFLALKTPLAVFETRLVRLRWHQSDRNLY
jgi:hypothetical protein